MPLPRAVVRIVDPHIHWLLKLTLIVGLSYPFLPIDLIPDRLPYIGHFDNVGLPLMGAGATVMLLIDMLWTTLTSSLADERLTPALQSLSRVAADSLCGRFVLRLILGRWPDAQEQQAFIRGFWATSHALPPLLRATAYIPAASSLLSRGMLLSAAVAGPRAEPAGPRSFDEAQMRGNLLTIWRGPPVRFLHIEKTAGSSLVVALAAQFHPLQIHSQSDRAGSHGSSRPEGSSPVEQAALVAAHRQAKLVWGHYDLPSLLQLDGDARCFRLCLLRDPTARILSLYYFWRGNRDEAGGHVQFARNNGLLAFLRADDPGIRNDIDNLYVRRLTGLYATESRDPLAADPEHALAAAVEALDGLDFVGLSERLGDCLSLLGRLLGFTPPTRTPEVNVQLSLERNALQAVRPTTREPMTDGIMAELARLTRLDSILYQRAQLRFEALLKPGPGGTLH